MNPDFFLIALSMLSETDCGFGAWGWGRSGADGFWRMRGLSGSLPDELFPGGHGGLDWFVICIFM